MAECGPNCKCRDRSGNVSTKERTLQPLYRVPSPESVVAKQPEGWHPCLKQKTRCVIRVLDFGQNGPTMTDFEATNSCHVDDAEVCPRVTAGSKSGEGYELCGPPNHAEREAVKLLLETYSYGAPDGAVAYLYGHTWLCMDCQHALTAANVKQFIVTGEPA